MPVAKKSQKTIGTMDRLAPLGVPAEKIRTIDDLEHRKIFSYSVNKKRLSDEEINSARLRDRKLVRVLFKYTQSPGQSMKNVVWRKYKGDPPEVYTLEDNKEIELPQGFVTQLIKSGRIHTFKQELDTLTGQLVKVPKIIERYALYPAGFSFNPVFNQDTEAPLYRIA